MKKYYSLTGLILVLSVALILAACGKKTEEAPTVETAETVAEAPPVETASEDLGAVFKAKVAEVDAYMREHDMTNTDADELTGKLDGFRGEFEELAGKAGADEELAANFKLAADAMALYVKSLKAPPGDLESLDTAIQAEAKWLEAKKAAGVEPAT